MKTALIIGLILLVLIVLSAIAPQRIEYYGFDVVKCYADGGFYSKGWCYLPNDK